MNVFPVISSTLSPLHVARFVKNAYKFNGDVTARILKTGISHTYLITADTEKYVYRIYSLHWRTVREINEEVKLLGLLRQNEIPVSYPLTDAQGEYIHELQAPEGLRYAVMFSFAKGSKMLNIPAELHYKVGQIMANLHLVTNSLPLERVSYTPAVLVVDSFEKLKAFVAPESEEMIYMKSLQTYLLKIWDTADAGSMRNGIVHLDIWFDNLVINNDTDITLFDFDFCGNGPLVLDIAYYVLQLYSTEKDEHELKLKQDSFLSGYESVSRISDTERKLIPAAAASIYFFYLGVQCSRFDDWTNTFVNEIYLKRFIRLLIKKWADYNKLPVE